MFAQRMMNWVNGKDSLLLNILPFQHNRYVRYDEYPRDEKKFPGKTEEVYPDYIIGWFLVVNPGTSKRIVEASKVYL